MRLISRFTALILVLLVFVCNSVHGQEEHEHEENEGIEHNEGKHAIFVGFGWTYIPQGGNVEDTEANGFLVPTIGLDYLYNISPKWEVGIMSDLELDDYLIVDQDLEREYALIVTAVGLYRIAHRLSVFAGAGIEIEHHKNLAVFRAGLDSPFHLKKGWILTPSFTADFKEGYDTWALKLYIGKEF